MRRLWRRRRATPRSVLISGLGPDTGGGAYVLAGDRVEELDAISSTGLAVSPGGRRLARLLWSEREEDTAGEVLVYNRGGLAAHHRVPALRQAHSALWQGSELAIVSTGTNSILWLDKAGAVARRWQAPGEGDCWHLNSLIVRRRRLLVSAFGRFSEVHAWVDPGAREGTGIVFDLGSGCDLLRGLSAPHNPLPLDRGWLVCSSGEGALLRLDRRGRELDRRTFPGWTRGLMVDGDTLYLGVSAHRLRGEGAGTARLVALRRSDLEQIGSWDLPCREIYDVAMVPDPLLSGLRAAGAPGPVAG